MIVPASVTNLKDKRDIIDAGLDLLAPLDGPEQASHCSGQPEQ